MAAPTASLHFDEPLLAALRDKGVSFTHVTLHVGAGTFLPVKVDDITQHKMHSEWGQVSADAAAEMAATKAAGGRVIPRGHHRAAPDRNRRERRRNPRLGR